MKREALRFNQNSYVSTRDGKKYHLNVAGKRYELLKADKEYFCRPDGSAMNIVALKSLGIADYQMTQIINQLTEERVYESCTKRIKVISDDRRAYVERLLKTPGMFVFYVEDEEGAHFRIETSADGTITGIITSVIADRPLGNCLGDIKNIEDFLGDEAIVAIHTLAQPEKLFKTISIDRNGQITVDKICPSCKKRVLLENECVRCGAKFEMVEDKQYELIKETFKRNTRDDLDYEENVIKKYDSFDDALREVREKICNEAGYDAFGNTNTYRVV